jgi:hypothetical protein
MESNNGQLDLSCEDINGDKDMPAKQRWNPRS